MRASLARVSPAGVLTFGVAGIPGWLMIAHGAARRRGWAAPVGTALFGLGLGFALTLLTAQEYGHTLVPTWLGLLALLPSAVGVVAITQPWRNRRASAHRAAAAGRQTSVVLVGSTTVLRCPVPPRTGGRFATCGGTARERVDHRHGEPATTGLVAAAGHAGR